MVKLQQKEKNKVVAGIQWTGYNLMEIEMFMHIFEGYPKNETQHNFFIEKQTIARNNGYKVPVGGTHVTASVGDWVVLYSDGSFCALLDDAVRRDYDILEAE